MALLLLPLQMNLLTNVYERHRQIMLLLPKTCNWNTLTMKINTSIHSFSASTHRRRRPSATTSESLRTRRRSVTVQDHVEQQFWGRAHHQRRGQPDSPTSVAPNDIATFNQYYNFRARCAATFISLSELKSYVDINKTGFDKILKKWDKVTGSELRKTYYEKMVTTSEPFLAQQNKELEQAIAWSGICMQRYLQMAIFMRLQVN
ncbi:unnamed protein product [Absidia cylindrospora]